MPIKMVRNTMTELDTSANTLRLIGGWLCLDFINTVSWREGDQPHDWLQRYPDIVAWSQHAGILTASQAQHLLEEIKQTPNAAEAVGMAVDDDEIQPGLGLEAVFFPKGFNTVSIDFKHFALPLSSQEYPVVEDNGIIVRVRPGFAP